MGADAGMLFDKFMNKKETISFKESVEILNDLSYLVIPVDQRKLEFKMLISTIKSHLVADNGLATQHNFELVEALCKMRVDSLNDVMRDMIRSKKLSRKAKDISA